MSTTTTLQRNYYIMDVPAITPEITGSYLTLVPDQYLGTKQRNRRFSQYKLRVDKSDDEVRIEKLPHRPFIQGGNYNKLYGALKRHYAPIEADVTPVIRYCASRVPIARDTDFLIRVHQFRTIVTRDVKGTCVPEGPHRDGVDIGVMVCINRENVSGGETQITETLDGAPIFSAPVEAGTAIVIRDKEIYHNVTDIALTDGASEGYRDMLFWGFIPWAQGRYGEAHEDALESGLQVDY